MNKYKGFTLVELMIVVAIIGILSSLAVPAYNNHLTRAMASEAIIFATMSKATVSENISTNNAIGVETCLGVNNVVSGTSNIASSSCDSATGALTYNLTDRAQNISIRLTPALLTGGQVDWTCSVSSSNDFRYVPSECRNINP